MIRVFILGIVLGLAAAGAALHYYPAVNQSREQSLIVVNPNQGNTETFHVNVPTDRILIGAAGQQYPVPEGLEWPEDPQLAGLRAELFKIRNGKEAVVGVASRMAASHEETGEMIEWVLHLPARGSAYIAMDTQPDQFGRRVGRLHSGTREFAALQGVLNESWVADTSAADDGKAGRIELVTAFVSTEFHEDPTLDLVEVGQ